MSVQALECSVCDTKQVDSTDNACDVYVGNHVFESRSGHRLSLEADDGTLF